MVDRRGFLAGSAALFGSAWLSLHWPSLAAAGQAADAARAAGAAFRVLTPDEAADVDALASTIIPTDDTPGAHEAGVVWFVDQALATFMAPAAVAFRADLHAFNAAAGGRFALLDPAARAAALTAAEQTPFFGQFRFLTLAGMFAMPSYGGNRDHAGWRLIGFEHRHHWSPPFGYYDAD